MRIDPHHPRARSLRTREQLVLGVKQGITSPAGLIAHGRGEAFDYLLGEQTHPFASQAVEAAAAHLLLADYPALSVNGNVAALCADEMITLSQSANAPIEVNLFHFTKERVRQIESYLRQRIRQETVQKNHALRRPKNAFLGRQRAVLLQHAHARTVILPHVASSRKITLRDGIDSADVVFVPLEDGDRAQALVAMGKKVITIDLNPLSRTAQAATVTIVDNLIRALPLLITAVERLHDASRDDLKQIVREYDNRRSLREAIRIIRKS